MENISKIKESCVGCKSCEQSCPKHCISMVENKEGLYYLALIDKRIEKIQDNDDKLFEIYNLHIILESRLGKIENAKQYFNKICELKITERDFLTAVLNYTSGLIQDKKTDDAMFYMMKFKERFEKEYSNHEAYLATFYSNLAICLCG